MPAMRVIPSFNVGEDSQPRFLVCTEGPAIDQFTLQGGEEALAQCVVIAVASSPIEGRTPASRQRFPNAIEVYCTPWSEWWITSSGRRW